MPTITTSDLADLIVTTQKELGRMKFTQIATDIQKHEVFKRIFKRDKAVITGGEGISRNIMTRDSGAASQVGMFAQDQVAVVDVLQKFTLPWRHTTTNYAIERREPLMNKGAAKLMNLVQVRRIASMISLIKLVEAQFFGTAPTSSDELNIHGLKYHVVAHASTGFYGGAASGNTTVSGLSPTTYPKWKNYTALWSAVTKLDLIAKMRTASRKIAFEAPLDIPDYRTGRGQQFRIYMNESTLDGFETLAENQNENLGHDLMSMDGAVTFKRSPIVWIPYLDDTTTPTDPVYMLDWSYIQPVFLDGDFLHEDDPSKDPNSHNTLLVFIDLTWNLLFTQRRHHAVLATAA